MRTAGKTISTFPDRAPADYYHPMCDSEINFRWVVDFVQGNHGGSLSIFPRPSRDCRAVITRYINDLDFATRRQHYERRFRNAQLSLLDSQDIARSKRMRILIMHRPQYNGSRLPSGKNEI